MVETDCQDFYVSLHSDESHKVYPNNRSSVFENRLSREIFVPIDVYEVGLVELQFKQPEPPEPLESEAEQIQAVTINQPVFFPTQSETITLYSTSTSEITIVKPQGNLDFFQTFANEKFKELKFNLQIQEEIPEEGKSLSILKWEPVENSTLVIPDQIAAVLGFETSNFSAGEHKSTLNRNNSAFDELPDADILTFSSVVWIQTPVVISEPEKFNTESLILTVAAAVKAKKFKIGFIISKDSDILSIKIHQSDVRLQFSPTINKIFGLKDDHIFNQRVTDLLLPKFLVDLRTKNIIAPKTKPSHVIWEDRKQIYVQTNIVEEQRIGEKSLSVLRIVQMSESNSLLSVNFSPVIYLPLNTSYIRSIRVWLSDAKNQVVKETNYPTSVILHFRKRRI